MPQGGPRRGLQLIALDPPRAVAQELQANREPDFSSLLSPFSPRWMAARVYYLLLGECVCVRVHVMGGGREARTHRPEAATQIPPLTGPVLFS